MIKSLTAIDIAKVPFSKYGSYLSVCHDPVENCFTVHNARRMFGEDHILTIILEAGGQAMKDFKVSATPALATISCAKGTAKIYLRNDNALAIESEGLGLQLQMAPGKVSWGYEDEVYPTRYGIQVADNCFKMIRVDARLYTTIDVLEGKAILEGPFDKSPAGNERDCRTNLQIVPVDNSVLINVEIDRVESNERPATLDTRGEVNQVSGEWEAFLKKMPGVPEDRREVAEMCWYNLWSSVVHAADTYRYDAMLMSKKFMCSVWTWDHCFNALAAAAGDVDLGLGQFFLPFEEQAPSGALPDFMKPHVETVWGVTKPPIHGWCFQRLMNQFDLDKATLKKAYHCLERWTDWWMNFRDSDGDGVPEYPQGCDSGWDNSSLFDIGYFLESPDLSAYLILQMKCLAEVAQKLADSSSEKKWHQRADTLYQKLIEHSWNGKRFIAKLSRTHQYVENPTSLLALVPLVLGQYLDKEKFDKLAAILERDFLTENGPATEAPGSLHYESDSYWRGPIWAPSTYLIVDGLRRGGKKELAANIARGFCNMIRDKAGGNYENFDAITGKGLRAPGYTWTASVHLLLMWEYLN